MYFEIEPEIDRKQLETEIAIREINRMINGIEIKEELCSINRNTRLINEKAIKMSKSIEKQAESSERIAKELISLKDYESLVDLEDGDDFPSM